MNKNVLDLILHAEKEYDNTIKNALKEAEIYVDDCKKMQSLYIENLNHEWFLFEEAEKERLEKALFEKEKMMEADIAKSKERLRICQNKKADIISDRLMKEVLSRYGNY